MQKINFDKGWKFILDCDTHVFTSYGFRKCTAATGVASMDYHEGRMREVDLPHDYAIELLPDRRCNTANAARPVSRYLPLTVSADGDSHVEACSVGWYRKHVNIPRDALGKRIFLEFEGVFRDFILFVNGIYIDRHTGGYTGTVMEITDQLLYGEDNVIAVRVDASQPEGWWYEGAGIYRHVHLLVHEDVYIPRHTTFVHASIDGTVSVSTSLIGTGTAEKVSVTCEIISPDGCTVTRQTRRRHVPTDRPVSLTFSLHVTDPMLWDIDAPNLYYANVFILRDGVATLADRVRFGFREITFDPDRGMMLNGRHVKLRGACIHQDFGGFGVALPTSIARYKIDRLKSMGLNGYRSAHHPASEDILNACDELGMLVMDEVRLFGSSAESLRQLEDMVRQHRNHPCICLWSLGNEEYYGRLQSTEWGERMCRTAYQRLLSLDDTREVTFGANNGSVHDGVNRLFRMRGFNYIRNMDRLTHDVAGKYVPGHHVDRYHKEHPQTVMLGTEEGSSFSCRGAGFDDYAKGQLSAVADNTALGGSTPEGWVKFYEKRPFLVGAFMWTGFDYYGEPSPFTEKNLSSHFGAMDLVGIPKNSYHYFRSCFTEDTTLELMPHWDFTPGQRVKIGIYTNCEQLTLLLNGRTVCERTLSPLDSVVCELDFEPGRLEAVGMRQGRTYRCHLDTPQARSAIVMSSHKPHIGTDDIAIVDVTVTDKNGNTVPSAEDLITVSCEGAGEIVGIGNGDPSSFEPDKYLKTTVTKVIDGFTRRCDGGMAQPYSMPALDDMSEVEHVPYVDKKFRRAEYEPAHPDYEDRYRLRWQYDTPGEHVRSFVYEAVIHEDEFEFIELERILGKFRVYLNGSLIEQSSRSPSPITPYRIACQPQKGDNRLRIEVNGLNSKPTGLFGHVTIGKYIPAVWKRHAFYGQLRVFVKATEQGAFTLTATADGLQKGTVTVETDG